MRTIYADFNDLAADATLPLTCAGSKKSIADLLIPLTDDEDVVLSDGELTVKATVHLQPDGTWIARLDW